MLRRRYGCKVSGNEKLSEKWQLSGGQRRPEACENLEILVYDGDLDEVHFQLEVKGDCSCLEQLDIS